MSLHQLRPRQPGWNCWRAGDEPLSPPAHRSRRIGRSLSRQEDFHIRSPVYDQERSQRQSYGNDTNPNNISLGPRRKRNANATSETDAESRYEPQTEQELGDCPDQDAEEDVVENLPQLWPPAIDTLMSRTSRAYDLVLAYPRDAEGGLRWLASDIPHVREAGKHLHRDIWALKRRQRSIKHDGRPSPKIAGEIKREARRIRDVCKKVQGVISELEQKNEHELLRTGEFEADEGNIVEVRDQRRDDMDRQGGRVSDNVGRDGRNDRKISSSLFYVDTKPSGARHGYYSGSYHPHYRHHRHPRVESGRKSRRACDSYRPGQNNSYRPGRNDSSASGREGSYVSCTGSSSGGPSMLGKHILHF